MPQASRLEQIRVSENSPQRAMMAVAIDDVTLVLKHFGGKMRVAGAIPDIGVLCDHAQGELLT